MLTGGLKSQIDRVWDAFWSGGISNPLEVIEQIERAELRIEDLEGLCPGVNRRTLQRDLQGLIRIPVH